MLTARHKNILVGLLEGQFLERMESQRNHCIPAEPGPFRFAGTLSELSPNFPDGYIDYISLSAMKKLLGQGNPSLISFKLSTAAGSTLRRPSSHSKPASSPSVSSHSRFQVSSNLTPSRTFSALMYGIGDFQIRLKMLYSSH